MLKIIGLSFLGTLCVFFFVGIICGIVYLITAVENKHISNILFFVFTFLLVFAMVTFLVWSSGV